MALDKQEHLSKAIYFTEVTCDSKVPEVSGIYAL